MRDHYDALKDFDFYATGGTAQSLADLGLYDRLQIHPLLPGTRGGVVEMAARVARGEFVAVLFLTDPRDLWADVPENRALKRVCIEKQVHLITTRAGAEEWALYEAEGAKDKPAGGAAGDWRPDNWQEGLPNVDGVEPRDLQPHETTIALIAHDEMKVKMATFVDRNVERLARFHRILATGTTGWILRVRHASPLEVASLKEQAKSRVGADRFSKANWEVEKLPPARESQEFARKLLPLASGPKGGDVLIANEILEHKCHQVVFFYDPKTAHPHQADIRLLERTAQLPWVYAFCVSDPESADQWIRGYQRREQAGA